MSEVAIINTDCGQMVLELWRDVAPNTAGNFVQLANSGFYDGTAIHRVVRDFMIQGGDPLSKDPEQSQRWGMGNPGYTMPSEFSDRPHVRGVLSMARGNDPDSAGSQFFICLGTAESLDGEYTCFGNLIEGDEVLGAIGAVETERAPNMEKSRPVQRVGVEWIRVEER